MRYSRLVVLLLLSLLTTSCFEMTEEITLRRNGSGTYQLTIDFSELLANPLVSESLQSELGPDTTLRVGDMSVFDQLNLSAGDRQLLDRLSARMQFDPAATKAAVTLSFAFEYLEELNELNALMKRLKTESDAREIPDIEGPNLFAMGGGFSMQESTFALSGKRKLIRTIPVDRSGAKIIEESPFTDSLNDLMAGVVFTSIYHLPGKVKRTTFENATVNGKTVTVRHLFGSVIDGSADLGGMIKFK